MHEIAEISSVDESGRPTHVAKTLIASDWRERVAVFRHGIIGALATCASSHGDLAGALRRIAQELHRPPAAKRMRQFSVPTLERWLYAYKMGGLEALRPHARKDSGHARKLSEEQRTLLLDIRREHPTVPVPVILMTLRADGRLDNETMSAATLRRLYRQEGLSRIAARKSELNTKTRLRWQTDRPDALWHADVCHGPTLIDGTRRIPTRIHGMLDDHARYVVALRVVSTEMEQDMLDMTTGALRIHGRPEALYLDNGSTYRGEQLQLLCSRLGITLLHAKPYDPQARGKMERFWLTMRGQVLNYCTDVTTLYDLQLRLQAWLDAHYHDAPHAGLMGRTPMQVYKPHTRDVTLVDEANLARALLVSETRKVRRDTTISIEGSLFELDRGWLTGREIDVYWSAIDNPIRPWAEYEGKRYELHRVNAEKNASRKRPLRNEPANSMPTKPVDFDPSKALLKRAALKMLQKLPDEVGQ